MELGIFLLVVAGVAIFIALNVYADSIDSDVSSVGKDLIEQAKDKISSLKSE